MTDWGKGGLWRNRVGNQSCISRYKAGPESEAALCEMVAEPERLDLPIRVAGSGHSFKPVVGTTGLRLYDVTRLYPRAGDFRALRRRLDPAGRFLNDHVRMLRG